MSFARSRWQRSVLRATLATIAVAAIPFALSAQSRTERGEVAWKTGTIFALQGNADSALALFREARTIAESVQDSSLLAAVLRSAAEVQSVYLGCADSSLALLRLANKVSIPGDRTAGQLLIRKLAAAGNVAEARTVHTALYADLQGEVPRSITRESVNYLSSQAAIQRAAGQQAAAIESLRSARSIADRVANGDEADRTAADKAKTNINSTNYWVTFELAQLLLQSKTASAATEGKTLMNALAATDDAPEEGNERRFSVFRLADRLTVNAWRCQMNGSKCPVPVARKCP